MVFQGFELGTKGWQVQTNPLSYGGPNHSLSFSFFFLHDHYQHLSLSLSCLLIYSDLRKQKNNKLFCNLALRFRCLTRCPVSSSSQTGCRQCDQILEQKVAQMFPKVAQKVAKVVFTYLRVRLSKSLHSFRLLLLEILSLRTWKIGQSGHTGCQALLIKFCYKFSRVQIAKRTCHANNRPRFFPESECSQI